MMWGNQGFMGGLCGFFGLQTKMDEKPWHGCGGG